MRSLSVIKHRDILQNILLRLIAGLVVPPLIAFLFKAAKLFATAVSQQSPKRLMLLIISCPFSSLRMAIDYQRQSLV
jgi:Zn-dependent protease with chaperone function